MPSLKKLIFWPACCLLLVVSLAGCGGGGGGGTSGAPKITSTTISGQAVDGPINGAQITINALNSDGSVGKLLGQATTDSQGNYSINIGSYSGNVLVSAVGGAYFDAYTGNPDQNQLLRAAIANVATGGSVRLAVTPMTELAVQLAGVLTTSNITQANAAASSLLSTDITKVIPADVINQASVSGASANSINYGLYLAAISTMMNNAGLSNTTDAVSRIAGALHQNGGTLGSVMAAAMENDMASFAANKKQNRSGETASSITQDPIYSATRNAAGQSLLPYCISGLVNTPDGTVLPGVTVTVTTPGGTPSGTVTTDADGRYAFNVLTGGDYVLAPSLAGYTFSPAAINNESALSTTQDFTGTPIGGGGSSTVFNDGFSTENMSNWILFGSPQPQWVSSIFGSNGVFDNNGSGLCASGALSYPTFDFAGGGSVSADVYVDVTSQTGCLGSAAIGFASKGISYSPYCSETEANGSFEGADLLFALQYVGSACLQAPGNEHGNFKIQYTAADNSMVSVDSIAGPYDPGGLPEADAYMNGWHNLKVVVDSNHIPYFYVDNNLIYTGPKPIMASDLQATRVYLGDRSSEGAGKAYHDSVSVSGAKVNSSPSAWSPQQSGTSAWLRDVVWSGLQFVAVGADGTILTSPDGLTWTAQASGTSDDLASVAWSGSGFAAVGADGTILTSPDGLAWTARTSGAAQYLNGIAWSGSGFVAVGDSGTILTSPDGLTWTARTSGTTGNLASVAWSGSGFAAVGDSGIILTSPDGSAWTARTSGTAQYLSGIAWSGSGFAAVGANDAIVTSPDGIAWTAQTSGAAGDLYSVAWSDSEFVAVGADGTILTSPNGLTWATGTSGTLGNLSSVVWSGLQFVAVGEYGTIITSP